MEYCCWFNFYKKYTFATVISKFCQVRKTISTLVVNVFALFCPAQVRHSTVRLRGRCGMRAAGGGGVICAGTVHCGGKGSDFSPTFFFRQKKKVAKKSCLRR